MTDSTAKNTAGIAPAPGSGATETRLCRGCGSHFVSDFEEQLCAPCFEWAELYYENEAMARAVRGRCRPFEGRR